MVFRRREDAVQQLSPSEQREVYKNIQKGGDVPFQGLRKPAPERPRGELYFILFFLSKKKTLKLNIGFSYDNGVCVVEEITSF